MIRLAVVVVLGFGSGAAAQDVQNNESSADVAERVFHGGSFEQSKWRRGTDGALEFWCFADVGDESLARFVPLVPDEGLNRYENLGALGLLSLVCHGPGDLLSMTDAPYHFGALGVDTRDAELRQLVVRPTTAGGPRGRAELLDRLLAIDVLVRRGCKPAKAEFTALARDAAAPAALRARAEAAVGQLDGTGGPVRRHLDPATLLLPPAFDAAIVVDHAALPDMSWVTPAARRAGMLVTAFVCRAAGGAVSPSTCNGAQRMADMVSEAPFHIVHRRGNARIDQSCVVVTLKPTGRMPVALTWEAVGEFEHEGLGALAVELLGDAATPKVEVAAQRVFVSSDGGMGRPRPDMAAALLATEGCGVRVVVPESSKLWPMLAGLGLPAAKRADLRVVFGDPAVIELRVEARDEDVAEEWVTKGKAMLGQLRESAKQGLAPQIEASPDFASLVDALFAASISGDGERATARIEVRGCKPKKLGAIVEALARRPM